MEMLLLKAVELLTLMLLFRPCFAADKNELFGYSCSGPDNSTTMTEYQTNLNTLFNSLATNAPTHDGFYTASVGEGDHKIHGLTQCRGDISATDCRNCINNATAMRGCSDSKDITVNLRWCFIRYSNASFFGEWDKSGLATTYDTGFEDPIVVPEGINFMNKLISMAPEQPLMFQTGVLDVGQSGKRYGMAQCTRDISRSKCGKCLDYFLLTFRTTITSKRGWEIYGSSCSMVYHDFQFYFNSLLAKNETDLPHGNAGFSSPAPHRVLINIIFAVLMCLIFF